MTLAQIMPLKRLGILALGLCVFCGGKALGLSPSLQIRDMGSEILRVQQATPDTPAAALSDEEILSYADASRGNVGGIRWGVVLDSMEKKKSRSLTLLVSARGFDIHAVTEEPKRNKGDKVIMLNGNMWFHKPGLSKPVPISRRQKLLGDAAYGDIAATNYAQDYDATRLDDEIIDGEPCYVFDLKAKTKNVTYDGIRYWVSKERLVGIKAQYFTKSGKLFKSARMSYDHTVQVQQKERPFLSGIDIQDELISEDQTRLTLLDPLIQDLPDHIFNLNLLR